MNWQEVLAIIIGNAALTIPFFLWNRSEANADRRDMVNLIRAIQQETKDFHGRMCRIEESREAKK